MAPAKKKSSKKVEMIKGRGKDYQPAKIVDDKLENGAYYFLIKWKPIEETGVVPEECWVRESDCYKIRARLNAYQKRKSKPTKPKKSNKKKDTAPPVMSKAERMEHIAENLKYYDDAIHFFDLLSTNPLVSTQESDGWYL